MALNFPELPQSPAPCIIAYKEWAGVCRALGEGRQTILLRKGGIAESGGSFRPEYSEFWMYPTHLHEAQQGLRDHFAEPVPDAPPGFVRIELRVVVESVAWVDDLEMALGLGEFHVWSEETIRKRFAYRTPGVWALGVRAHRLPVAAELPVFPTHAGCHTWVHLDAAPAVGATSPVISDAFAAARREALAVALAQPNAAR